MDIVTYSRPGPARTQAAAAPDPRVAWVDTAKGVCIILVVMMHSTLGVGEAMGGEGFMHWVVAFAKPFRMPDFFLVSGLFLSRVIDRDWRTYADKRVVHFAYFYLLWLVVQSCFKYGQLSEGSPLVFAQHLVQALWEPYSTLWFIYLLAVFSVVTKILRRVMPPVLLAGSVVLQILPIDTGSFLLNEFCERWVYFLAGYMLAPYVFSLAGWASTHVSAGLAGLAAWSVVNGALALHGTRMEPFPTLAELPGISLALGLAGALAIVVFASILTRHAAKLAAPLRYCGRNSISIYLAFFLPMAVVRTILVRFGIVTDIGLVSVVVTAAAVLAPLVLERLVRRTPLSGLFHRPAWAHLSRPHREARVAAGSVSPSPA